MIGSSKTSAIRESNFLVGSKETCKIVDPTTTPDWDTKVCQHPSVTFFHGAAWARTLKDAYGFTCQYIAVTEKENLCGLLPVMETRSWLRGRKGVCLPFTDECAPLESVAVSAHTLMEAARHHGQARHWNYLEQRGGVHSGGDKPTYWAHRLPLDRSPGVLLGSFDSAVRRAIRKAERAGVTVEFRTDIESIRTYYRLHCRTRTKHGAPPQPFHFFKALWVNALQNDNGFVALAFHNQRPIAGAVFLKLARHAIYKFSASDERFQDLRGSNIVIWKAMCKLIDAGVTELNFGKTSLSNEGLRRFKRSWGSEEYVLHYQRYSFAHERFVKVEDVASGAQARVFALLPIFVSRWIGRAVYPHLN